MNKLAPMYEKIKNALSISMFKKHVTCLDLRHVEHVVKSHYGLGMLSVELDLMKFDGMVFAFIDDTLLFDVMFTKLPNGGYQSYKMTLSNYEEMEALARTMVG